MRRNAPANNCTNLACLRSLDCLLSGQLHTTTAPASINFASILSCVAPGATEKKSPSGYVFLKKNHPRGISFLIGSLWRLFGGFVNAELLLVQATHHMFATCSSKPWTNQILRLTQSSNQLSKHLGPSQSSTRVSV